jgi:hypothetical protein
MKGNDEIETFIVGWREDLLHHQHGRGVAA